MGRARKAPIIQAWLDYIPNHGILNTGVFYNSIELYKIFLTDIGSLVSMNGFTKFLNKVANDTGYPNFKRREKRSRNSKEIFYIYSKNDSVNSCNNDRQTRYRKRYPAVPIPHVLPSPPIDVAESPSMLLSPPSHFIISICCYTNKHPNAISTTILSARLCISVHNIQQSSYTIIISAYSLP